MRISKLFILLFAAMAIAAGCLIIDTDVDTDVKIEGDINVTGDIPDPTNEIIEEVKNALPYDEDDSGVDMEPR